MTENMYDQNIAVQKLQRRRRKWEKQKAIKVTGKQKKWIWIHTRKLNYTAHCAFYYMMVHKKSKNLKNGHFLQSRNKIVLIEIKFAKFWHIGEWRAPVCLIDTLKNLVFYSKVTIKGGVKQVSKKLNLCRFSSSMTVFI